MPLPLIAYQALQLRTFCLPIALRKLASLTTSLNLDEAAPKLDSIGFETAQYRLADVLRMRGVLKLSSGCNCRSSAARSLHSQVLWKTAAPVVNDRLMPRAFVNLHGFSMKVGEESH
jgi:hypothetical protein